MENFEKPTYPEAESEIAPSPLAKRLLDILPNQSGNQILEIGAREADIEGKHIGDDCVYLARENSVTLVETGEGIISDIREKAIKSGTDGNIKFLISQFDKLGLSENEFDAAFSLSGLDSTYLPWSLKEVNRVLKPGGKALIFIYYKMEGKLIQGPENVLEKYVQESGLQIDHKQIKVIDEEKGLEAIIFELHK
ncbi:MAG: class I SAM-dependent methyltransferase [Acidobacteriaceae bacterium]